MVKFFKRFLQKKFQSPKVTPKESRLQTFLLIAILLLALGLRLFQISQLRLTHDEMSIGYNAYSILKTGRDEWGTRLPLVFKAFGDNKLPTYIYTTVISVALFGLNALAVKLPSVLAGVANVAGVYFLASLALNKSNPHLGGSSLQKKEKGRELLGNFFTIVNPWALFAAFLMAINPWTLHLSRMAFESNLALTFFIFGLIAWLKAEKLSPTIKSLTLPTILLTLSAYTYIAYRLYVPMLLATAIALKLLRYFLYQRKGEQTVFEKLGSLLSFKKTKAPAETTFQSSILVPVWLLIGFVILMLPFFTTAGNSSNTSRLEQLFYDQQQGATALSTEQNNFCFLVEPKVLAPICRKIYHPKITLVREVTNNYASFLTPDFLFVRGDKLEYLSMPGFPDIYTILLPFYVLGIVVWLQRKHKDFPLIIWAWLLAPIPAALSGSPQIVRGTTLIPFAFLFITVGIQYVFESIDNWQKNNLNRPVGKLAIPAFVISFVLILGFSALRFMTLYFFIYPHQYRAYFYQTGQAVAEYLLSQQGNYQTTYITNDFPDAHILLAFYGKIDPAWYQQNVVRPQADKYNFQHPTQLDNFKFGDRIGDVVTDKSINNWLYVSGPTDDNYPTKVFKGYSGVHKEVNVTDVDLARKQLKVSIESRN